MSEGAPRVASCPRSSLLDGDLLSIYTSRARRKLFASKKRARAGAGAKATGILAAATAHSSHDSSRAPSLHPLRDSCERKAYSRLQCALLSLTEACLTFIPPSDQNGFFPPISQANGCPGSSR